jgi:hypothetical protein
VDAGEVVRVLSFPSGAVTSVLVPPSALWTGSKKPPLTLVPRPISPAKTGGERPSLRGRRGKPRGSTWAVHLKQRVRGEWNDSASPSVSFLDISPAKAGREFRAPSGSSLGSLDGGGGRACEVGGGRTTPIRASSSYYCLAPPHPAEIRSAGKRPFPIRSPP